MQKEKEVAVLLKTGITVAFIALSFLGTLLLRVPIPGAGYFNLGDAFVMLAAVFFGPLTGLLTGMIGPALADLIGFPPFVPATAIVKGLEGLLVGLIAHRSRRAGVTALGLGAGVLVIVAGYFLFEALIYPAVGEFIPFFLVTDLKAAVIEIAPNTLQGVVSALITLAVWRVFKGKDPEHDAPAANGD